MTSEAKSIALLVTIRPKKPEDKQKVCRSHCSLCQSTPFQLRPCLAIIPAKKAATPLHFKLIRRFLFLGPQDASPQSLLATCTMPTKTYCTSQSQSHRPCRRQTLLEIPSNPNLIRSIHRAFEPSPIISLAPILRIGTSTDTIHTL